MDDNEKEKELLDLVEEAKKTDLQVLIGAKEEAKRRVMDNPSPAALAALDRATRMLNDFLSAKEQGDGQDPEEPAAKETPFTDTKNAAEVLRWLQDNGYQKEKTQFYDDIREGRLRKNGQGVFTFRLVKKFARTIPRSATGKSDAEGRLDISYQKQEEEVAKLRINNEREKFKFDLERGKYVDRNQLDLELAARLVVLETGLRRLAADKAPAYIHIASGDQARAEELAHAMTADFAGLLNSYATTRTFHVLILPDQDGVEETEHPTDADQEED